MESVKKHIDKEIIYHDDYMYPIFRAINRAYTNDWNENGCSSWTHEIGKLYQITIVSPYTLFSVEYPDGLRIKMSEDGFIENAQYGQELRIRVPEDWNLIKIDIDNKEIKLTKKNEK